MSKILDATCDEQGVVTADELKVTDAIVLSEGKQASEGLLILDQDRARYLTSNATDIKTTIEKVDAAITSIADTLTIIANTLTAIGTGMTGPTTAPPATLAVSVANINSKVTALNATKSELEQLKGALK